VDESVAVAEERSEPSGTGDLMETVVEPRQHRRVSAESPRLSRERFEHGRAIDPLHDQLGAVGAEGLDPGRGIAALDQVPHDPRLHLQRAAVARTAQDEARAIVEDVGVAAEGVEAAGFAHGSTLVRALGERYSRLMRGVISPRAPLPISPAGH